MVAARRVRARRLQARRIKDRRFRKTMARIYIRVLNGENVFFQPRELLLVAFASKKHMQREVDWLKTQEGK